MGKGQPEAPCGCTVETSMLGVGLSSQELARPSLPWGPFLRPQTRWVPSTLHLSVTQPCTEHLPPLSLHHTGLQDLPHSASAQQVHARSGHLLFIGLACSSPSSNGLALSLHSGLLSGGISSENTSLPLLLLDIKITFICLLVDSPTRLYL